MVIALIVASALSASGAASAWVYDDKHRGNDNDYDYLFEKWKIIAETCWTEGDGKCGVEEVKVEVTSGLECELIKFRLVTQWVIDNKMDHWRKVGECVRSDNNGA